MEEAHDFRWKLVPFSTEIPYLMHCLAVYLCTWWLLPLEVPAIVLLCRYHCFYFLHSHQCALHESEISIAYLGKITQLNNAFLITCIWFYSMENAVRMAPNFSEAMIGKLSLGASILQSGGFENVFRQNFSVGEREILLKACQCYLSTTTGPIAGLLFISTEKIAFCSERSLTFTSSETPVRAPYKVILIMKNFHPLPIFQFPMAIFGFWTKLATNRNLYCTKRVFC